MYIKSIVTAKSCRPLPTAWTGTAGGPTALAQTIYSGICGFMNEDALACYKFQEVVAGRATNPNPSRKVRRTERLDMLKLSLKSYKRANMKEFLFGNYDTV